MNPSLFLGSNHLTMPVGIVLTSLGVGTITAGNA